MTEKDWGTPAKYIPEKDPRGFSDVFPTPTKGDGKLRPNNVRTGAAQGKGGWKKKVRCQQCGFLVNLNTVDYSGGSLDGSGAGGAVTTETNYILNGQEDNTGQSGGTVEEIAGPFNHETGKEVYNGDQAHKKGAGCPFCFSKNSTKVRNLIQAPTPRPKVGF